MTEDPAEIGELDLLAFVDGRLDPARRREVEAYLATRPQLAQRVREDLADNEAIRAALDPTLAEAVPDRLLRLLERRRRPRRPYRWKAAAAAAMLAAAGLAGWTAGKATHGQAPLDLEDFFEGAADDYALEQVVRAEPAEPLDRGAGRLAWQSGEVAVELAQPDLSEQGFRLVDRRLVSAGEQPAVRMTYENRTGRQVSLFLKTHWQDDALAEVAVTVEHDRTRAYWVDGPFAFVLAGELPERDLVDLARSIDAAMDTRAFASDTPR